MLSVTVMRLVPAFLLITSTIAADKQIKLEDIEKDNLKSDQQAKIEKQYQQYQQQLPGQQYQQYQQYQPGLQYAGLQYQSSPFGQQSPAVSYQQPGLAASGLAYQPQQQPYVLPYNAQQYLQQSVYQGNYPQLGSNAIGGGYQGAAAAAAPAGPVHPFQSYFSQQLTPVPAAAGHSGSEQQQSLVMAYSAPSIAAFQQQAAAYYQGLANNMQQYVPNSSPNSQIPNFYYQQAPESSPAVASAPSAALPASTPLSFNPQQYQQYVPPFQALSSARIPTGTPQYQTSFPSSFSSGSPYSANQVYSQAADLPTFRPLKSATQSAASLGQQQQYLQAESATINPLQNKYQSPSQYQLSESSTANPIYSKYSQQYLQAVGSTASPTNKFQYLESSSPLQSKYLSSQQYQDSSNKYLSSQQYVGSTVSPLQAKYLNSPQFLSQNYNTLPSSHLAQKSAYSGAKPTASPTLKIASQGGFLPNNPQSSSSGLHYQSYRSISG